MHTTRGSRRRAGKLGASLCPRRGQSTVEMALAMPVLLLVIFAILDFALALQSEIDFNGAVSNGIRAATIVGADSTNDDTIGQGMLLNMRLDDPNRSNYYDVQLIQSRQLTDYGTNTYKNFYAYNTSTHAFNVDPYAYVLALSGSIPSPCQYFYEAHAVYDVDDPANSKVYLDQAEQIQINPLPSGDSLGLSTHLASVMTNASLMLGCGRYYDVDYVTVPSGDKTLFDETDWTCANDGAPAPHAPGAIGNLCYYYPEERINEINPLLSDNSALPDEIEVDINYTYSPLGNVASTKTLLGRGFTITEHARGRIEPQAATS